MNRPHNFGGRRLRILSLLLLLFLVGTAILGQATAPPATNATGLVSINNTNTAIGNNSSELPLVSSDGRYVVFQSRANNLAPNDVNGSAMDVFVRDRQLGTTQFVSINRFGTGSGNQFSGNALPDRPPFAMTPDGRYVVFQSNATDLVSTSDFNSLTDIFVRDLQTGTTTLVSVNASGTSTGNEMSFLPVITPNGRYVAFQSVATNLTAQGAAGVFVRDMQTGITTLASVNNSGVPGTVSLQPDISDNGRVVAFQSNATNLAPNDTNGTFDIFARDLQAGTTTLVSINAAGTASANGFSGGIPPNHVVSADGRYILFQSNASDLTSAMDFNGANDLFLRDLQTNTTRLISITLGGLAGGSNIDSMPRPGISADGRYVVFSSFASDLVTVDTNNSVDVFVRDNQTATTTLVSFNGAGTDSGNDISFSPVMTPNGRYICFGSLAFNLTTNDTNAMQDVFIRDMQTGVTTLLNVSSFGASIGNGLSSTARLTSDGRYVVFNSNASNLVPTPDTNDVRDVFIYAAEPQFGTLQFEMTSHSLYELGGSATIKVTRTGGWDGPVSVNYSTSDGTATAGADYLATSGTLLVPDGTPSQSFTIPVLSDSLDELNETINITLSNAAGGATLGSPTAAILTIVDQSRPIADFDGDGKTDVSVFRPSNGYWYVSQSSNSAFRADQFGMDGDLVVPGDYDGDGKTDIAVFRPSNGNWYFLDSSNGGFRSVHFGQTGDIPAPGHYDADGKSDIAVWRPGTGKFYFLRSTDGAFQFLQWGQPGDSPVVGDYDVDGTTDFAVFRPSTGTFYVLKSTNGGVIAQQFGQNGDKPIAGDFDGDGKTDIAVFRPSTGVWYYLQSSDTSFRGVGWGSSGDVPAAGDYDGDGKWDVAVFRPSTGTFYILQSANNSFRAEQFGANGDVPIPSAYVY